MANSRWQTNQYYLYLACACAADVSITRLVFMIMFFAAFKMLLPTGHDLQPCTPSANISGTHSPHAVRGQRIPSLSGWHTVSYNIPTANVHHRVGFKAWQNAGLIHTAGFVQLLWMGGEGRL